MANTALYTNGQFVTCSGFDLGALSRTVTGATAWFQPTTIYAPVVLDCNGGTGQNLANQPTNTSPVLVQQVNACTWTASPVLDSTGSFYRVGVAETVKITGTTTWVVQLRNPKAQLHAVGRAAGGKPKKEDVMKWVTSLLGSCFLLAVLDSRGELSSARPSTCV